MPTRSLWRMSLKRFSNTHQVWQTCFCLVSEQLIRSKRERCRKTNSSIQASHFPLISSSKARITVSFLKERHTATCDAGSALRLTLITTTLAIVEFSLLRSILPYMPFGSNRLRIRGPTPETSASRNTSTNSSCAGSVTEWSVPSTATTYWVFIAARTSAGAMSPTSSTCPRRLGSTKLSRPCCTFLSCIIASRSFWGPRRGTSTGMASA